MAKTFIGELILKLRDNMSGAAKQAAAQTNSAIDSIERAAKKLNSASWGGQFEARLHKLGATASDLDRLRASWDRLQASMNSRGLNNAAMRTEIANWKLATVNQFAQMRAASDAHLREVESRARTHANRLREIMKPVLVMMGGYTGAYMTGVMGREALTAASEEQRQAAEAKFAGLSEQERSAITKRSEELAKQYRMPVALFMEMLKDSALNMPDTQQAINLSESMAKSLLVLSNMFGSQSVALEQMRAYNKAMDNLNINANPADYLAGLQNYMKMQQVVGKDLDPAQFAMALKYARTSGKVFSDDFLFKWLPLIISETGGSDAGTQLRAGFDQFIVGRASKAAREKQEAFGIRKDGKLIGQDAFAVNPIKWVQDYLLPQLQKKGVDTNDQVELARIVGELTNNRLSGDLLMRAIQSFSMYERLVTERFPNAMGIDAADQVQELNPFAAYQGFLDSLRNLAGALGGDVMPTITAGLNSMADGINKLQQAWRDGDPMAKAGILGAGAAAGYGTWKIASAIWGLITAGTNLNAAAVALQAAAVSLGAKGAIPTVAATGATGAAASAGVLEGIASLVNSPIGRGGLLFGGMVAMTGLLHSLGLRPNNENKKPPLKDYSQDYSREENAAREYKQWHGFQFEGGMHRAGLGAGPKAGQPPSLPAVHQQIVDGTKSHAARTDVDMSSVDAAASKATQAGQQIKSSLDVSARPVVDTSSISEAVSMAKTLVNILNNVGAAAASAKAAVTREMNRNLADHGVAP